MFNHMHTIPQVPRSEARAWMFNYDAPMWYFMGDHHSWVPFSTGQCEFLEEALQQGKAYTVLWVCEATSKCDPGGQHHLQSKIVSSRMPSTTLVLGGNGRSCVSRVIRWWVLQFISPPCNLKGLALNRARLIRPRFRYRRELT